MSGLGAALSGLVGGYQQGRNTRHEWDDRKSENARKKRKDEILDAQEKRAQDKHDRGLMAWDRDWADSEDLRSAIAKDMGLAEGGPIPMGATPTGGGDDAVVARPLISGDDPTLIAAATQPAASLIQPVAMGSTPAAAPVRAATVPMGAMPEGGNSGTGSLWDRMGQAMPGATMEQVAAGGVAGSVAGMPMGAAPGAYVNEHGQQIVGGVAIPPAQALNPDGTSVRYPEKAGRRTLAQDAGAVRDMALGAVPRMAEQVGNQGIDLANTLSAPSRWFRGYVFGDESDAPGQKPLARADLNRDGITETVASPILDGMRPAKETPEKAGAALKVEQEKTPAQQEMAASATEAVEELASNPATKTLAEGVTLQALGATPGSPMTAAQLDKGTKDFMKDFRATGAPNMVRALLRQGDIAGAQSLETFLRSDQAQKGTELWLKGSIQAMLGDTAGAAETFIETFNTPGYYDDGYEILRDQSEIIKDKAGQAVGARLMFRNQATGETFARDMSPEEMGEAATMALRPDEAWAAQRERAKALQDQLIKQQEEDYKSRNAIIEKDHEIAARARADAGLEEYKQTIDPLANPTKDKKGNPLPPPMTYDELMATRYGAGVAQSVDDVPRLQRAR